MIWLACTCTEHIGIIILCHIKGISLYKVFVQTNDDDDHDDDDNNNNNNNN